MHSSTSYLSDGVAHKLVDGVGHLRSLHTVAKLHAQHTRVVSEPPVISFVACQPCAVDTRLLTRTDTNNLSNTQTGENTGDKTDSFAEPDSFLLL